MFLHTTKTRNPELIDFAFYAHRAQKLLPDTYIVDVDGLQQNAADILAAAKKNGITLYFMLKQLGRNPALAGIMAGLGWAGAVAVDWREALHYAKHSIPLGNVGHLVQPPAAAMERILAARPDIVTVYSLEKAKKVGELASALGRTQDVMLRVTGENDPVYSGQTGGFSPAELGRAAHAIRDIPGIRLAGVCSFPCLLYDDEKGDIIPTPNAQTVLDAAGFLRALGEDITQINLPSASCAHSMELISALGGTHAEPGHSLTGTTPWNSFRGGELPSIVYLSEVSHNFGGKGYCFGGGHYRRGHMHSALAGSSASSAMLLGVAPPDSHSIDYHFELSRPCSVGDAVIMAFRTQIFVTRSHVALVEGLHTGNPGICGIYDSQGVRLE